MIAIIAINALFQQLLFQFPAEPKIFGINIIQIILNNFTEVMLCILYFHLNEISKINPEFNLNDKEIIQCQKNFGRMWRK
jgi:hypothetical protein